MEIVNEETGEVSERVPLPDHLNFLERGKLAEDLTIKFDDLVKSVMKLGKKGSLTLKLDVSPSRHGEDVLEITPVLSVTKPKEPRRTTLMFADDDGNLHRQDPNQTEMELRKVASKPTDLKEVKKGAENG